MKVQHPEYSMPIELVRLDCRNHSGVYGNETTHYFGHYLINGEMIDDEGHTDRGDDKRDTVIERIIELLEIPNEQAARDELFNKLQDLQFDCNPVVLDIVWPESGKLNIKRTDLACDSVIGLGLNYTDYMVSLA